MDFLDPAKKRAHGIRLFIGYFLIGVALTLATVILVFQANGYDFNRSTGTVIQNGLVFVAAQPESAAIYVNNVQQKARTDTRLTLPAGQYNIRLERDGYRTWQRTFNLNGGSIERLVYPVLWPTKLVTNDVQLYAGLSPLSMQSPDRRWLLVEQPGSLESFDMYDLTNPTQPPVKTTVPTAILTPSKEAQSWKLVEWSTDNRHVLLEHLFGSQHEFVMVDRETPASSFNVDKAFKITPDQVALHDKHFDSLFIYNATSKGLSLGSVKDGTVAPYLNGVRAFKPYGSNMMLYATEEGAPSGKVLIRLREDTTSYTLRQTTSNTTYLLDMARFSGAWYVAAGATSEGRTYIFKNPLDALKQHPPETLAPISILRLDNPLSLSFSNNTRFIMVQSGNKFSVYDADDDRRFSYQLKFPVDDTAKAVWMDGHRLMLTHEGKTYVWDFDGVNQQSLSASSLAEGAFFDRDYLKLFNVAPSVAVPGRYALTQTDLKAKL
ncbi:MAG: hypothetical protein JWS12_777 [Candidatus Saccharibacteria bacterium]|nr:hypothetical protein [Candidatus Saccharibacteria bacterium]